MTEFIPIGRIFFMLFSYDSINFSASFPVLFCIFPSACEKICCFFIRIIRFFRFPLPSFGHVFPCYRDNFHVFCRAGKEIILPVFIIFVLFPGLFKGKIRIFRNEFSVRPDIFSPFRLFFVRPDARAPARA